jgi:hypothetical protein
MKTKAPALSGAFVFGRIVARRKVHTDLVALHESAFGT